MAWEPKDMHGAIFPNGNKTADNQPDMRGDVLINGHKWSVAGWWKQGQRGDFLSLAVSEPRERTGATEGQPPAPQRRPSVADAGTRRAPQPSQGNPAEGQPASFTDDSIPF